MSLRSLTGYSIAALAGAAMFALPLSPASAFSLSGPSLEQPIVSAQIDKVWWRGGYGYRGGYGWRGGCCGWGWGWGLGLGVGLGWSLAVLPYGYSTYWWGGVPYYYANNNYYVWDGGANAYEAVDPPSGLTSTAPPASTGGNAPATTAGPAGTWTDLYAYPKGGQSMEQQTRDRDECHKWAVGQTGYDPSQPSPSDTQDLMAKRQGYLRAEGACLEARNYSVK